MPELTAPHCPERETLSNFLLGKLDPQKSSECESHLAHCQPCIETISGLDISDTFQSLVVESVGESNAKLSDGDESVIGNLIHRMVDVGSQPLGTTRTVDQRAADVVSLLEPAKSAESIGQIEHYQIEEVLGCGSTGVVFRAIDENLNRPVAIKVLRPTLGDAARERFIAEARATAILDHQNIVTIYQVGDSGSFAFIVMQWLPGETLEQRLERESALPPETVKEFGQQIARGLAAAHRKGLVHRDIKPANLWITENDQVKILDFGLVRIMDESPQLTCTGVIAGTPCYMSPEQSRGDELDARSDLFSLGCVLYQSLTGKLPFASSNALATLQAIQRVQPASPSSLDAATPADVSDLVMTLLEKSPHRRPDSASDLADAFGTDRQQWPFACDDYCERNGSANAAERKTPKAALKSTQPAFWKSIALAMAAGAIGWGAFLFGPQIIRIATNQGEIVIQSNDPDVQVEVLSGGETIEIVDLKTKQSIQIESGNYQIRAVGDQNSISIDKETLTLSRGESAIVTVTKNESDRLPMQLPPSEESLAPPLPSLSTVPLKRPAPVDPFHKVGAGDVLSVFVEHVFGNVEEGLLGLPVHVRSNGTISLPLIKPVDVAGKTVMEIEDELRKRYSVEILLNAQNSVISVLVHSTYSGKEKTLSEPVYDGMTFAQCFNAIHYERDGEKLKKPILGILELKDATGSPGLVEPLLAAVIRVKFIGKNIHILDKYIDWLTDEQLQSVVVSMSASDSNTKWAVLQYKVIEIWNRIGSVHKEIVANTVIAMNRGRIKDDVPESILIKLLQKGSLEREEQERIIPPLLKSLETSENAAIRFAKLAKLAPDMNGLGAAIAEAISRDDSDDTYSWGYNLAALSEENQKAALVPYATRLFRGSSFDQHTISYLGNLPPYLFELIEPEFEKQVIKDNDNDLARRVMNVRAGKGLQFRKHEENRQK